MRELRLAEAAVKKAKVKTKQIVRRKMSKLTEKNLFKAWRWRMDWKWRERP